MLNDRECAFELYNSEENQGKNYNLADSMKEKTLELTGELQKLREEVNAQMPIPNQDYTNND